MASEPEGPSVLRRVVLPGLFLVLLFGALWVRRPAPAEDLGIKILGRTMGTTYTVLLVKPGLSPDAQKALGQAIETRLAEVNQQMSTYLEDSEISRFNRYQGVDAFTVSDPFKDVVQRSIEVSERSEGAFDVTVGPLVDAWGFGPEGEKQIPDAKGLAEIRADVGYSKLSVTENGLLKSNPGLRVDLSAIAKGWGVDQIAALLRERKHSNFMVEIGGEVFVDGLNTDGVEWRLGVEKPTEGSVAVREVLGLTNQAIATSGDYRNFLGEGAERRSHSIDPRTGYPIEHGLAQVTVVMENCTDADAWATALTVLGPDAGFELAESSGWAVLFLIRTEEGVFQEKATQAFIGLRQDKNESQSEGGTP